MLAVDRYLATIRSESQALAAAARAGGIDSDISTCPGWKMGRLVGHVGTVHQWAAETVRAGQDDPVDGRALPRPPEGHGVIDWLEEKTAALVDTLHRIGPEAKAWNFSGAPNSTHFWFRRMAHETSVHRWDGEHAATGSPAPLDPALAADGVDEFLEHFLPQDAGQKVPGTIHLHATDIEGSDGEWLITLSPEGSSFTKEHGKGDVAVRGPASDLLLLVWN
ncbi:MAG: hypothetical protein QOG64_1774, partial [Acidimicrobiaceae bacterium]|nr:hypothetical protein [Acidimicrobiaceae bacterium]